MLVQYAVQRPSQLLHSLACQVGIAGGCSDEILADEAKWQ